MSNYWILKIHFLISYIVAFLMIKYTSWIPRLVRKLLNCVRQIWKIILLSTLRLHFGVQEQTVSYLLSLSLHGSIDIYTVFGSMFLYCAFLYIYISYLPFCMCILLKYLSTSNHEVLFHDPLFSIVQLRFYKKSFFIWISLTFFL